MRHGRSLAFRSVALTANTILLPSPLISVRIPIGPGTNTFAGPLRYVVARRIPGTIALPGRSRSASAPRLFVGGATAGSPGSGGSLRGLPAGRGRPADPV